MNSKKEKIYAKMMERLIHHFRKRNDVQNIDIMNLAGFCRNCLSKWYVEAANEENLNIDYNEARELIYGMPYIEWKSKFQTEVSNEKLEKLNKKEK
tara:strand:- start:404 stop:691 length:288 start_codon:yes stop_codon:yes gene_type:complete